MNSQEIEVNNVLNSLRPAMEADDGGVQLVHIDNGIVYLKFRGACLLCPSIKSTLGAIRESLQSHLVWVKGVERLIE
jgi:NifU-like protein